MSGSRGTHRGVRRDPRAALPGHTGLVPGAAGSCRACTSRRHRCRAVQEPRAALRGRAMRAPRAAGPCGTPKRGHAGLAAGSAARCRTGTQSYGAVQGLHPVLRGRARLANGAAGHRSTRTQRCGAGQDSHPAPCGAAAVQTPARLTPHCGATWDPALGPSWSPRPHLRPQGWRGPHPACPQPPAAVPCRASQPGATRACRHTPTTGAQEPLLAPCGGSREGGAGAPPPPAPTAVGPSTSPSTPRHPRVPARHQRGSLRITSTPHRAAGGPPATAGEGGVPGDGRPGPRPPMHRCPPSSVPFTVTGRDGDGAGDLSEPPRALAPVPALPPGGAPSPSQHRPRPPPEPGLGTHPHPAPAPRST